jgi:predicted ferric reductase
MSHDLVLIAAASEELPTQWLLARASGLLAYLALTATVVAGLTLRGRFLGRTVPPVLVTAIHRTLSVVGIGALALHGLLIVLDGQVDVPLVALLVPGTSEYRPVATGLGVIAAELWLLVHLSFRLRGRIGVARWRALHMLALPAWLLAATHGILSGSDSAQPWTQQLYAWSIGLVVLLFAIRIASHLPARTQPPTATPVA